MHCPGLLSSENMLTDELDRWIPHPRLALLRTTSIENTHVWLFSCADRGAESCLKTIFFLAPDARGPNDDETIAVCRPVPITDDTWPTEVATARLWKLAFTPNGPLVYGWSGDQRATRLTPLRRDQDSTRGRVRSIAISPTLRNI